MDDLLSLPLLDLIHEVAPELSRPTHLEPWCRLLEECIDGGVRGLCAVPIRHFKTRTTLFGIAWLLLHDPTIRVIGMCADHERATELAKLCRQTCELVADRAHVKLGPKRGDNIILDWKNENGGGVVWMSAEQSKLGRDVDVLICDDPITEKTAGDPEVREAVDRSINHYAMRAGRAGRRGSVALVMSRWHPDDPIGRRLLRHAADWVYVHNMAILEMGTDAERAFAPEVMTLEEIKKRRAEDAEADPTEALFWAQFQNMPFVQAASLYTEPTRYDRLPDYGGYRTAYGIDAAFSRSKRADWFAVAAIRWYGSRCYVLEVRRFRADHDGAVTNVRAMRETWGPGSIHSYMSGPEIGAIPLFASEGIAINALPARFDKRTRAQASIRIWNEGRVLWPSQSWTPPVIQRFQLFRGVDGDADDEVDAFVSAFDGSNFSSVTSPTRSLGAWRY